MINPLAQELNDALKGTTPGELLSDVGTRLYFPKGIIAQSAEAKKLGKLRTEQSEQLLLKANRLCFLL